MSKCHKIVVWNKEFIKHREQNWFYWMYSYKAANPITDSASASFNLLI
jgi:hypothetical protein